MIKILRIDTSGSVRCPETESPMLSKLRGLKTMGGFSLDGKFPDLTLILKDGYESPSGMVDYFEVGLLNVISAKFKAILENCGAELEYFLSTVLYNEKPTAMQFFVENPLKRIKGIDVHKSEVKLDEELGDALWVKKLVLDESKFADVKLGVIDEIQCIGVKEELASAIVPSGCTGCSFVDPITIRYGYT